MTGPTYDRTFWEQLWATTLRDHPDKVARRAPNAHLVAELDALPPGRALDAGCGHGVDALWLAARGWHVTALDFAADALAYGRSAADALGPDVAGRLTWVAGDLATWPAPPAHYDLVISLYVHAPQSIDALVRRLASAVAPGGTLFMVGHRGIDQVQVSVEGARAALDPDHWELAVAEARPRTGSGFDAVIRARRAALRA